LMCLSLLLKFVNYYQFSYLQLWSKEVAIFRQMVKISDGILRDCCTLTSKFSKKWRSSAPNKQKISNKIIRQPKF